MYLVSFALPTALYPPGKCSSDIFLSPLFQACLQVLVLTWVGTYLPDDASGFLGKFNIYTMVEQLSQSPFPPFLLLLLLTFTTTYLYTSTTSASAASETNSINTLSPTTTILQALITYPSGSSIFFCYTTFFPIILTLQY